MSSTLSCLWCRGQRGAQLFDLLALGVAQAVQVIDALSESRDLVIGLIRALEIGALPDEQVAQESALAALPGETVTVEHPLLLHRLPAPLTGACHDERDGQQQVVPPRCSPQFGHA